MRCDRGICHGSSDTCLFLSEEYTTIIGLSQVLVCLAYMSLYSIDIVSRVCENDSDTYTSKHLVSFGYLKMNSLMWVKQF